MTTIDDVKMERDQVIGFYEWLLEEDNFGRVTVAVNNPPFTRERCEAALSNWRTCKPDANIRPTLSFECDTDAVFFKMKFT